MPRRSRELRLTRRSKGNVFWSISSVLTGGAPQISPAGPAVNPCPLPTHSVVAPASAQEHSILRAHSRPPRQGSQPHEGATRPRATHIVSYRCTLPAPPILRGSSSTLRG